MVHSRMNEKSDNDHDDDHDDNDDDNGHQTVEMCVCFRPACCFTRRGRGRCWRHMRGVCQIIYY